MIIPKRLQKIITLQKILQEMRQKTLQDANTVRLTFSFSLFKKNVTFLFFFYDYLTITFHVKTLEIKEHFGTIYVSFI